MKITEPVPLSVCNPGPGLANSAQPSLTWVGVFCMALLELTLTGCTSMPSFVEHDIPNFRTVSSEATIYRGGQPQSPAAWAYLHSLGVSNVVKLNLESELSDNEARALGMTVSYFPIDHLHQLLLRPNGQAVSNAVAAIKPGTYVHCKVGHDRTGLIIGCKRVWQDGWTKDKAWHEMLAAGLDVRLRGLVYFWEDVDDKHLASKTRPPEHPVVLMTGDAPLPLAEPRGTNPAWFTGY